MSDDEQAPAEKRASIARETYAQLADPRIFEAIEARSQQRLTHDWNIPINLRNPRLHVEPEDWGAGQLLVVRERDSFSPEMQADLHELTPQASLRDLYRPVHASVWIERELRADTLDPGGRRSLAEARAAQRRDPLPRVRPLVREVVAEQARRRALLAERWQPAKPDDEPRTKIYQPGDFPE
jgi:hypothetical protein